MTASQNPYKRAEFHHYAFMVVETWCAYGLTLDSILEFRDEIAKDTKAWAESVLDNVKAGNPALLTARNVDARQDGLASFRDRSLVTWPPNPLWTEFLVDLGITDEGAENAEAQLQFFYAGKSWTRPDAQAKKAFFAALQLWYYGYPSEKVCMSSSSVVSFIPVCVFVRVCVCLCVFGMYCLLLQQYSIFVIHKCICVCLCVSVCVWLVLSFTTTR